MTAKSRKLRRSVRKMAAPKKPEPARSDLCPECGKPGRPDGSSVYFCFDHGLFYDSETAAEIESS